MSADTKILLVIEGHAARRDELAEFLRGLGFIAIPVADAASATVVVQRVRPDLNVWDAPTDDAAPVIAGWRVRRPGTSIVTIDHGDDASSGSGADVVLRPPLVPAALQRVIARLLHGDHGLPRHGD
jgi:CheY-like chemotaxis protein